MSERQPTLVSENNELEVGLREVQETQKDLEYDLILESQNALFLAIVLTNPNEPLDEDTERIVKQNIKTAMDKWQKMDIDQQKLIWLESKNRTAKEGVHDVLEHLKIMAGKAPLPQTGEYATEKIPDDVYDLASDTFLLILHQQSPRQD